MSKQAIPLVRSGLTVASDLGRRPAILRDGSLGLQNGFQRPTPPLRGRMLSRPCPHDENFVRRALLVSRREATLSTKQARVLRRRPIAGLMEMRRRNASLASDCSGTLARPPAGETFQAADRDLHAENDDKNSA